MKEARQVTNDKPTSLEEVSLQESEKPPEEMIQQAAMTISQEISQQVQGVNQVQKAKLPTHHRSEQLATTKNKASPDESPEPEKDKDVQAKTDSKGYSSTQSEQAKSQEQDCTTNQETPAEEQQLQDQSTE